MRTWGTKCLLLIIVSCSDGNVLMSKETDGDRWPSGLLVFFLRRDNLWPVRWVFLCRPAGQDHSKCLPLSVVADRKQLTAIIKPHSPNSAVSVRPTVFCIFYSKWLHTQLFWLKQMCVFSDKVEILLFSVSLSVGYTGLRRERQSKEALQSERAELALTDCRSPLN